MKLNWQARRRARVARDPRFDGKFFVGCISTRIYCRPSCPVPTVADKNVRYFSSAAAAAEAGFRPCLRCRPECSPGTPAWLGTSATVSRALRLIAESDLQDGGIEHLAERLGVGSRHLRRLFLKHLGATPGAVVQTRRLHFAKKLIDETALPMSEVALAAGYGCVRRFNASIRRTYQRTPTQIRRLARQLGAQPEHQYEFRLRFRPPYHWQRMLAFLAPRATPGIEVVEGGTYRRSISLDSRHGWFEVALDEANYSLAVRVEFPDPRSLFLICERIRAMFDLNADWMAIVTALRATPLLARPVEAAPGLRVPGCWDGFELTTRAIIGQQISVKGATALAGRLVREFGISPCFAGSEPHGLTHIFPTPDTLADAKLTRAGLTSAKAETISVLARTVCDRRIRFEGIVDSDAFQAKLCELPGIGAWTAQYVAMRALGDPDAFPSGDLGLLRAAGLHNSRDLESRAEAWRPWRAYAAMYLWSLVSENRPSGKSSLTRSRSHRGAPTAPRRITLAA
jgi:AraC family transcriptional regulator of adaptative response / DNA-3-methyladenine glycosylase II